MKTGYMLLVVLLMALVSYLPRVLPLAIFQRRIKNIYIQSFLLYMPYGILTAMIFPATFSSTGSLLSASLGTAAALILSWMRLGLLPVAAGAVITAFLTENLPIWFGWL